MHDLLEQHEEQILKLEARLMAERKEREEGVARERELEKIVEEVRQPLVRAFSAYSR